MKIIYRILTILFLNIATNNLYTSSNNKRLSYDFNQHFYFLKNNQNNTEKGIYNENSEFSINPKMLKKSELEKLISSTITQATEKAQSLGMSKQPLDDEAILKIHQNCLLAGLPIYAINNYLYYIQNEPSDFDVILRKAYKSGKDYLSNLNKK